MLSSRLTRGIVVLNLGGLVALLGGFLYLNQFREGLIDARVQSLQTQGEIITAAVAASATIDTDAIDPEKLLKLAPGESYSADGGQEATGFSLNPERIGPLLRNLVSRAPARAHL
jgi:two-component system sensor histidine kinase ChvG